METIRLNMHSAPMATRASDIRTIENCPSSWLLRLVAPEKEATYNLMGQRVHEVIAESVLEGLDRSQAVERVRVRLLGDMKRLEGVPHLSTKKRPLHLMADHGERCVNTYFDLTDWDSPKRITDVIGNSTPEVEKVVLREAMQGTKYAQWATIDALYPDGPIIDWKCSPKMPSDFFQLNFYRFVLRQPDRPAYYVNLWSGEVSEAVDYPGDEFMRRWAYKTEQAKESLLVNRHPYINRGPLCKWCPVAESCPLDKAAIKSYDRLRKTLRPQTEVLI